MTKIQVQVRLAQRLLQLDQNQLKLVIYLQRAVQELLFIASSNDILETKLYSRNLLAVFHCLFEDMQDHNFSVQFDFTSTPHEESQRHPNLSKERPDGMITANMKSIGFVEVEPLSAAGSHQKIHLDLY